MQYEKQIKLVLLVTVKQFSPGQISTEDFLHLLEKEMLAAAREMIQNKQTVNRYGSSDPRVNRPSASEWLPPTTLPNMLPQVRTKYHCLCHQTQR